MEPSDQPEASGIRKPIGINVALVVGGMAAVKQERILSKGPEIVVATPGRLWELIQQGNPHLSQIDNIRFLAIDETDRMLEKGHFQELHDILERINLDESKRKIRQYFVFSATLTLVHEMPKHLKTKSKLSRSKRIGEMTAAQKLQKIVDILGISDPKVIDITAGKEQGGQKTKKITESSTEANRKMLNNASKWRPVEIDRNLLSGQLEGLVGIEECTDYDLDVISSKKIAKRKRLRNENTSSSKKKKGPRPPNNCTDEVDESLTPSKSGNSLNVELDDTEVENTFMNLEAWTSFGLPQSILKGLEEARFSQPTYIQTLSLPSAILGRKNILGAAETGSGKTLAFGLPILTGILNLKQKDLSDISKNLSDSEESDFEKEPGNDVKKHPGRTLIFCNSIGCVKRLATLLNLLDCHPLPLHASMPQRQRIKNLERLYEDIPVFPIQQNFLNAVKHRVNLARELDKLQLQVRKANSEAGWFQKAAEEMDIIVDDFSRKHDTKDAQRCKKSADIKRKHLASLLATPIFPKGFSGSYPLSSQLSLSLNEGVKEEKAVDLMKNTIAANSNAKAKNIPLFNPRKHSWKKKEKDGMNFKLKTSSSNKNKWNDKSKKQNSRKKFKRR
nr:ATP-dependent RNA helicase DDX24-like [Leptinotarsa decemlineata]